MYKYALMWRYFGLFITLINVYKYISKLREVLHFFHNMWHLMLKNEILYKGKYQCSTPLVLALSVLLWLTASDYPFGPCTACPSLINGFWLPRWSLHCLSFFDGFWLPLWHLQTCLLSDCLQIWDALKKQCSSESWYINWIVFISCP